VKKILRRCVTQDDTAKTDHQRLLPTDGNLSACSDKNQYLNFYQNKKHYIDRVLFAPVQGENH